MALEKQIKYHLDIATGTEVCIICRNEHRRVAERLILVRDGRINEGEDDIKPQFKECINCERRCDKCL
jgi:hypothetical protein